MAVSFGPYACGEGLAVMVTSGGTKYAVGIDQTTLNRIEIYKNIDGTPSLAGSAIASTVHGTTGTYIAHVHAAIDSNDDIHVVSAADTADTRDIAYRKFATSTDTWSGSWEQALFPCPFPRSTMPCSRGSLTPRTTRS